MISVSNVCTINGHLLVPQMVASKYLYDEGVDEEVFNDEWAESAKIEVDEINDMERDFLAAIVSTMYSYFVWLNWDVCAMYCMT